MNEEKTNAHSHTGDKPIGVNNWEKSQAIVSVNLPNAWLYYDKLGFKMVPLTLQLVNGRKVITNMPPWKKQSLTSASIKPCHNTLAIITGEASHLTAIDFDISGTTLSAALTEYGLEIDNYCYALTPSGGRHIYLNDLYDEFWKKRYQRKTLTTTNRKIGIDIRAEGGLIFAPPSIVEGGGNYQWINSPVNRRDLDYDPNKLIPLMDAIFEYNHNPSPLAPAMKEITYPIAENCYHLNQQDDYEKAEWLIKQLYGINIDYKDWIRMGLALKNKFGNSGLTLWLLFADNFVYQDTIPELTQKWNTFHADNSVKFGTFLYLTNNYITNNKIIKGDNYVINSN